MKYEVLDNFDAIIGCSYKGRITCDYFRLVESFGQPLKVNDREVNWVIRFEDGVVCNIYNWNHAGAIEDIEDWNVSGFEKNVIHRIYEIIK
jgi:hypothetical protein